MKLSEMCRGYILEIAGDGFSSVTVKYYRENLNRIVQFIGDKEFKDVSHNDIASFYEHIRAKGVTNATVQVYWKIIRSLYNFAERQFGHARPDKEFKMPVFQTREIKPFSKDELAKLSKACKYKRDKALVLALLDTGLRISELARVIMKDVDLETGAVTVRPFQTGLKSRSRVVYMGKTARKAVWAYVSGREVRKDDFLFATSEEKPMDRHSLSNILVRIGKTAGVDNVHPHRFRHTFAIEYLRSGGDVFTLQRLLGHGSLEMVKHYLSLAQEDIEDAYRKNSPADRMRL